MITLDSIRAAADAKYGATEIDLGNGTVVRLLNVLRLTAEKRAEVRALRSGDADSDETDQVAMFHKMIRAIAETPAQAEALLTAVGDDLALLAQIVSEYAEGTQAGEA